MTVSQILIAVLFIGSGMLHFIYPRAYESIMPPWLPAHRALVLWSGAFEIAGGIGIALPATRVAAGWGLVALLVAMFPANVQMLLNAHARRASKGQQAALVARLPMQPLLIWWVIVAVIRPSA